MCGHGRSLRADTAPGARAVNLGLDNVLTTSEAECIARFALERATILELNVDQNLAEAFGAAGAIDCLTLERILEISG